MADHYPQRPADDGPPPLEWSEYQRVVRDQYQALLAGDPSEAAMQSFLEHNPALVPGGFPHILGHGAFPEALISQPALNGIGNRRPDFMWLARNSAMIQPTLIEIERPGKRWIAGTGRNAQASSDLTQALNQLRQWEDWLETDPNPKIFLENYGIPPAWRERRAFRPSYWLIYGRRDENDQRSRSCAPTSVVGA